MSTWPPVLADLKLDMGIADTRDDTKMALDLAAAIAYVQATCADDWNFDGTKPWLALPTNVLVNGGLFLGTLRLAGRTVWRRRSPDGMVAAADLGNVRVPSSDVDIERMLGTGRYSKPLFA